MFRPKPLFSKRKIQLFQLSNYLIFKQNSSFKGDKYSITMAATTQSSTILTCYNKRNMN